MPKYINSKFLSGGNIIKLDDGKLYRRTGNYKTKSDAAAAREGHEPTKSLVIPTTAVNDVLFTGTCSGASAGVYTLSADSTLVFSACATDVQLKFLPTAPGSKGDIVLDTGTSTCTVTLSVNNDSYLVFDSTGQGSGPVVFNTSPLRVFYNDCNVVDYEVTYTSSTPHEVNIRRRTIILPPNHNRISLVT